MARYRATVNGDVPLTAEQETVRDTEEAAALARLPAEQMIALRYTRDELLSACDDRFLGDTPTGRGTQAWRDYRQALRDLPANTPDPANVVWPTKPV